MAACDAPPMDNQMKAHLDRINHGLDVIEAKNPGYERPKLKHGYHGPRYYVEVPIVGRKIDVFKLVCTVENLIK